MSATRRRLVAALALVVTVVVGLVVTRMPDSAASDIAGDALYAVAAYLFVVFLAPRVTPLVGGTIAAGWCVAVELFQLTGLPEQWGAAFGPLMLVLGTVFDARDLLIYVAAATVCALLDAAVRRRAVRNSGESQG